MIVIILGFAIPINVRSEPKNPHCLHVTWNKAEEPVTGYRVYCFLGESQKSEIMKDIGDVNQEAVLLSGLKPGAMYRVGITSVSSGIESKLVYSENQPRMRK